MHSSEEEERKKEDFLLAAMQILFFVFCFLFARLAMQGGVNTVLLANKQRCPLVGGSKNPFDILLGIGSQ